MSPAQRRAGGSAGRERAGLSPGGRREFIWVVLAIALLCLMIKLPTLGSPHREGDEVVCWTLAKNLGETGRYSLQGSPILRSLSPFIYDRPLFHHPPLFAALLVPFVSRDALSAAVTVPWLGHVLCIVAVAVVVRCMLRRRATEERATSALFWFPVLGVALDPVLTLAAGRLWPDAPLAGLCAMSVALCFLACESKRPAIWFALSGAFLGLATLTKLPALGIVPVNTAIIVLSLKDRRSRLIALAWSAAPALVLAAPWFVRFYREYGVLVPSWIKPDDWLKEHYPFVRMHVARPAHFYVKELVLLEPLVLLCAFGYARNWRKIPRADFLAPLLWFVIYLGVLTAMGAAGTGFQMRYLSPLYPSLYLMWSACMAHADRPDPWFRFLGMLAVVFAAAGGCVYNLFHDAAEVRSIIELAGF